MDQIKYKARSLKSKFELKKKKSKRKEVRTHGAWHAKDIALNPAHYEPVGSKFENLEVL
jgi:hypothetical protein